MGLFKRNKTETETKTISLNSSLTDLLSFFGADDILELDTPSLNAATYYACMQIRCNAIAKLPLMVMKATGEGTDVFKDHSLYELLRYRPNSFTNSHDFLFATEYQRLEYGDAFWVKKFSKGKITAIYLLDSSLVSIFIDDIGLLGDYSVYYLYNDPKKGQIIYREEEICHFKNFTLNGIQGTSIKKYISGILQQEKMAVNVLNNKYKNGLQDPIIVEYAGDLNEARQTKIQKKFAALGGPKNAGKVVPIPSDFKAVQLTTKLVDNQFFELNGLNSRNIANAFGVKSFQLNDLTESTYSNIEQQNRAFYSDTMQNVLTTYELETTYKLLPSFERDEGIFTAFNVDAMLRSDIESRYNAYRTGIEAGYITIAEVRKKENLPFIPGTDKLIFGNGAAIPVSQIGNQYDGKGGE